MNSKHFRWISQQCTEITSRPTSSEFIVVKRHNWFEDDDKWFRLTNPSNSNYNSAKLPSWPILKFAIFCFDYLSQIWSNSSIKNGIKDLSKRYNFLQLTSKNLFLNFETDINDKMRFPVHWVMRFTWVMHENCLFATTDR